MPFHTGAWGMVKKHLTKSHFWTLSNPITYDGPFSQKLRLKVTKIRVHNGYNVLRGSDFLLTIEDLGN